ncbi:MAG: carbohydrate deacetylase [Turicibacter sp.]|nr:carbohydrate deacetylase [Turicibacter sp.]
MKRLIINSDDFGMTEGVTLGTIATYLDKGLSSTTCMMNMPYAGYALHEAAKHPGLGVGIHLVLTMGKPILGQVNSLTDEQGFFRKKDEYYEGSTTADHEELYQEWKAQIEKFIQIAGKLPTHIDSHHHMHGQPEHQAVSLRLAEEYGLRLRQETLFDGRYDFVRCEFGYYGDDVTVESLIALLDACDDEVMELMVHTAFVDELLCEVSTYALPRMKEMAVLRGKKFQNYLAEKGIQLINYGDL